MGEPRRKRPLSETAAVAGTRGSKRFWLVDVAGERPMKDSALCSIISKTDLYEGSIWRKIMQTLMNFCCENTLV